MGIIIAILEDCDSWMRMNIKMPDIVSGTWRGTQWVVATSVWCRLNFEKNERKER